MAEEEPQNVRKILTEMKDVSDLMIDLAYSSLLFESEEIANQVGALEKRMDELMYQIRALSAISVRNFDDAEGISGVLQIANAAERISNATGDLANIILRNMEVHPIIKGALKMADEKLSWVEVGEKSKISGRNLSELNLPSWTGAWVLALKRGESWTTPPDPEIELRVDDELLVRGSRDEIKTFCKLADGSHIDWGTGEEHKRLQESLANMRDTGCLMVDMAYSSVLFNSKEVAEEIRELEGWFDKLNYEVWREVMEAAREEEDVMRLNSVLQIVKSIERISDAADLIADVVLREVELHPVFKQALEEADERITRVEVSEQSPLVDQPLEKLDILGWKGAYPLMIKRKDHYIFNPTKAVLIRGGDRLIIKGSEIGVEQLGKIAESQEMSTL